MCFIIFWFFDIILFIKENFLRVSANIILQTKYQLKTIKYKKFDYNIMIEYKDRNIFATILYANNRLRIENEKTEYNNVYNLIIFKED